MCDLTAGGACFPISGTLSIGKLTLDRPSLQSFICNLLDSGRHVTSPNQGLPYLAPRDVKSRDPGNKVVGPLVTVKGFATELTIRTKNPVGIERFTNGIRFFQFQRFGWPESPVAHEK